MKKVNKAIYDHFVVRLMFAPGKYLVAEFALKLKKNITNVMSLHVKWFCVIKSPIFGKN